jgi:hypothetical protein
MLYEKTKRERCKQTIYCNLNHTAFISTTMLKLTQLRLILSRVLSFNSSNSLVFIRPKPESLGIMVYKI